MIALILVGGEGTRLRPLTYDTPKPMLPIVDRPIIARIVEWLARSGVKKAVLSLGYRPDAFVEAFPDNSWAGVELSYAVEPSPLDTAGAIRFAAFDAGVENERLVIVNGDILTDLDLAALEAIHNATGGEATIALTPVEDPSAFGVVATDEGGKVTAFIEKPSREEAPTNFINAGTYIFEPSVVRRIEPDRRVSIEREIFPGMVEEGALYAMPSDAYWVDTGSPDRYVQAQLDILRGLRPMVELGAHEEIAPGVRLERGAKCEGSLEGVVFIGEGAVIGEGATVVDSVVGKDCVIEPGAYVCGSILLPGSTMGRLARCVDSIVGSSAVVGEGASLGAFTVLGQCATVDAQARLDGARVPV